MNFTVNRCEFVNAGKKTFFSMNLIRKKLSIQLNYMLLGKNIEKNDITPKFSRICGKKFSKRK